LTALGIVLVLANWYVKPEAALAWTAPLAMFAVMAATLELSRRARRRSTGMRRQFAASIGSRLPSCLPRS
jgi:hypothetical protein